MATKRRRISRQLVPKDGDPSLLFILGDEILYPKPDNFEINGFDLVPDYPWWIDLRNPGATLSPCKKIWAKYRDVILADWARAGLPGQPSWEELFGKGENNGV
jgi:hypothetical protein